MAVFNIYKRKGLTPLQALTAFKEKHSELAEESLTYAGRLDPLAEGVLLLLSGEDISKKEQYLALDKTYLAKILFGFETDTFDVLGIPKRNSKDVVLDIEKVQETLKSFVGKVSLPLPAYSSPPVQGKPLFAWARENKLDEIEIPERTSEIHSVELKSFNTEKWEDVLTKISQDISLVSGDFRQAEILNTWKKITAPTETSILEVQISCASGTYIRSVANELGNRLGTSAVLLSLQRTKVGDFEISASLQI